MQLANETMFGQEEAVVVIVFISGGFKGGAKRATAPSPAPLVTQKGPRTWEKI